MSILEGVKNFSFAAGAAVLDVAWEVGMYGGRAFKYIYAEGSAFASRVASVALPSLASFGAWGKANAVSFGKFAAAHPKVSLPSAIAVGLCAGYYFRGILPGNAKSERV